MALRSLGGPQDGIVAIGTNAGTLTDVQLYPGRLYDATAVAGIAANAEVTTTAFIRGIAGSTPPTVNNGTQLAATSLRAATSAGSQTVASIQTPSAMRGYFRVTAAGRYSFTSSGGAPVITDRGPYSTVKLEPGVTIPAL